MANEFIARKGLIVLTNGATITGSLKTQGDINSSGYSITASRYTGSFYGDGSQLTGITATGLDIDNFGSDLTGITVAGTDKLIISDAGTEGRINVSQLSTPLAGTGLEASSGTIRIAAAAAGDGLTGGAGSALAVGAGNGIVVNANDVTLATASAHFISGARSSISVTDTVGSNGVNLEYSNGAISATLVNDTVTVNGQIVSLGGSTTITANTTNTLTLGNGLTGTSFNGGTAVTTAVDTASAHFTSGVKAKLNTDGVISSSAQFTSLNAPFTGSFTGSFTGDGSNLTGIASTLSFSGSSAGSDTLNLKTEPLIFSGSNGVTATVTNNTITIGAPAGTVTSSAQIDVRNTTGIETIATTGSNTFTGVQTISNTTNSTTFADGALIVQGGVGIAKDVNISGSLNVTGVLTAVTMSTQYVTSSQYTVGVSRIILNDDDLVRFAGISVIDSGSTYGTGSLLWDSFKNHWIYQADDQAYNSAVLIAGPKNFGTLGDEPELVVNRIPVASGGDHIDNRPESSSIRVDFPSRLTHIEAGLYITGAVTSSVGFSGDGSQLTGIATNLNIAATGGGTAQVALKTETLQITGSNGLVATATGDGFTISGSDATTTTKGVASFTGSNFTVTGGEVSAKAITFNSVPLNLGSSYAFGLQNITSTGASTSDQLTLNGGAIIHGVLFTSASNLDVDTGTEIVATVATGSYDAAFFDYVIKKGSNYRAGTVTAVWEPGTTNVEFTDVSTNDLGNTAEVIMSVDLLSATARLKATVSSDNWIVKTAVRAL